MKNMKLCAILIFAFITLTNAQWLETTIYVPDSLCGIHNPQAFTYNETNNTIYVGGYFGNCVIAIDGATNEKIARIPAGEEIMALCWNSTNNKVYCANQNSDNVTVIDGAINAIITTIGVGNEPCALVYNPTNNKVYCANYGSGNVTVIDGTTNAVITTITAGDEPCAFAWNYAQNRTYVANHFSSSISVIRDSMTGVEENDLNNVVCLKLHIYPNPFSNRTDIRWQIPGGIDSRQKSVVSMKIYDATGRLIKDLSRFMINDSRYSHITWLGDDSYGRKLPSGVYFLKFKARDYSATEKLLLIR